MRGRDVIVDLGSNDELGVSSSVEIFKTETVDLGGGEATNRVIESVVGKVTVVTPTRSIVHLGIDEIVSIGQPARRSDRPVTASTNTPPRAGGFWEVEAIARPFLPLGTSGVGAILESGVGYRAADIPFRMRAHLSPVSLGAYREGSVTGETGALIPSYDGRHIEVGIGAGIGTKRTWTGDSRVDWDGTRYRVVQENATAPILVQHIRFGSLDGVSFEMTNTVVLLENEFRYAGFGLSGRAPMTDGVWLAFRGEGYGGGTGYGEAGLRFLVHGTGGPGSLFLTPLFGGASLGAEGNVPSRGGPMIGLDAEWRL
jgi:hypothetical protein